jgi:hypothetical protein
LIRHTEATRRSQLIRESLDDLSWLSAPDGVVDLESALADYLRWCFQQADRIDLLRPSPPSILDEHLEDVGIPQELVKECDRQSKGVLAQSW